MERRSDREVALDLIRMALALLDRAGEPSSAARLRAVAADLEAGAAPSVSRTIWRAIERDERRAVKRENAERGER